MVQWVKLLFLISGFALLAWAIQSVDLDEVLHLLGKLGFGVILILLVYALVTWIDAVAWKFNFHPEQTHRFNLLQLWRIRQIGEAYNTITPLGTVGGEPVKAQLLKDNHGLTFKEGLASAVAAKTTFLTGLILFFIPGIVLIFQSERVSPEFKSVSLAGMTIFSTLIFLFFLFQVTGVLGILTRWTARFCKKRALFGQMEELDDKMSGYYRKHPLRGVTSVLLAFLGWVVGLGELYLTLHLLGHTPTWEELWIMESLAQLVRVGTFYIPLSLGAQEGGLILIFMGMGLPANLGLTVSFVRRIKELFWVTLGLMMGWGLATKPAAVQADTQEG